MQNVLKSNEWQKTWGLTTFKLKHRRGDQITQWFYRISSPQEIRSPLFNFWTFENSEKSTLESCRMYWNLMNDKQFGFSKLLKLKYRMVDEIIQTFCRIGSTQEIRSLLLNLQKFQKCEKRTPESCRMYWNLMNEKQLGSSKLLKLKYRREDQIIQSFCRIGVPQEIRWPLFNFWKFENSEKISPQSCTNH